MAPPPPQTQPPALTQRLMNLAQTLQFAWFCGHAVLLLCVLRYELSYITFNYYSGMAQFTYRTAFVAAAGTYGIVVYKGYRTRARQGKPQQAPMAMLADENIQYLLIALMWLFSRQIMLALLPFAVYSTFHVLTYTRSNLIPAINGPGPAGTPQRPATQQTSALSNAIGNFVKARYDVSMSFVAGLEIALWFRILLSSLLLQKGAMLLLVSYTAFLRARFAQSSFVQGTVRELSARVDSIVQNQSTPPAARGIWEQAKFYAWKATEATDLRKYLGGAPPASSGGPRKSQ